MRDPLGIFTFKRLSGGHQVAEQGRVELRGAAVRFAIAADRDSTLCELDLQRYRFARSPVFMTATGSSHAFDGSLLREPDEWRPRFTPWASLSDLFERLREVLRGSEDIALLDTDRTLPSFADAAYDAVADLKADRKAVLAKTALLNIYYRLRTAGPPIAGAEPWFSFVQKVIAIDKERVLAYVEPEMARVVREVLDSIEHFKDDFEPADSSLHRKNVPAALQPRIRKMFSIKSSHDQGNYQLTIIELGGPDAVLLDADIDESGTFWGHARDLFKHVVTGGTHPVDIHEILVRQERTTPGFDLGYALI
ncbi:MAG: hypothetical protein ABIU38_22525 [Vicinamibacteraceae bacterium]